MEVKKLKSIFIDTNFVNDNGSIKVHDMVIKNMELQHGEKVIAYQEGEYWEGEIVYADNCWSVELLSDTKEISKERQEGQKEGYLEGIYIQSMRFFQAMRMLNYSEEEIEKIKECLEIK